MLRRRLQEATAKQWTDAALNEYLNLGLQFLQTAIMQVKPEEFIYISSANLVEDDNLIPKPPGLMQIKRVYLMYSGETTYIKAEKWRSDKIEEMVLDTSLTSDSDRYYAEEGRWVKIWPTPSAASSAGMKLWWVPTLTMGSDSDVPDVHLNLHEGVVYRAQETALGDTDEITDPNVLRATQQILSVVISRIPLYYQPGGGEPDVIEIDIDVESGWV
jgi:hypothetical protein